MEQSHIIKIATDLFAKKIRKVYADKNKFQVVVDGEEETSADDNIIKIMLLNIEYNENHNSFERIQMKETDKDGNLVEYNTKPPTLIDLKYMLLPKFKSKQQMFMTIGELIKVLNDNNAIEIKDYDWVGNNGNPLILKKVTGMSLNEQLNIFNAIGEQYSQALFYETTVGISSQVKEVFRRVDARKFDLMRKAENKK